MSDRGRRWLWRDRIEAVPALDHHAHAADRPRAHIEEELPGIDDTLRLKGELPSGGALRPTHLDLMKLRWDEELRSWYWYCPCRHREVFYGHQPDEDE